MYKIEILKAADKSLRSLPLDYRTTIAHAIYELTTNPRPNGCKKINHPDTSVEEFFRLNFPNL